MTTQPRDAHGRFAKKSMSTFKVGDTVRIKGVSYTDKRDIGKVGMIKHIDDDFLSPSPHKYKVIPTADLWFCEEELELVPSEITWETLKKGDKVQSNSSIIQNPQTVIETIGDIVFLSRDFDDYTTGPFYSRKELAAVGYTIIQPEPPKEEVLELTVREIEEKFGKKVKIIKE